MVPRMALSTALGALAAGVVAFQFWGLPRKPYQGFDQPAHSLLSNLEFAHGNFLVVSSASGEGAFISEVAMREQRPDHIILRSSKFLSSSTWNGTNYQLCCHSTAELREFLDHAPIDALILDNRSSQQRNTAQLQAQVAQALLADPNWKFRDGYPKLRHATVGRSPQRLDLSAALTKLILKFSLGCSDRINQDTACHGSRDFPPRQA